MIKKINLKKQSEDILSVQDEKLKKKLTIRQVIRNDNDFISYFNSIKLWKTRILIMNFMKENKIIDPTNKNLKIEMEVKVLYETDETIILITTQEMDEMKKNLQEIIYLIKISSFNETSEEENKVHRRLSQIEYLFMKKTEKVFCQVTKIYDKTYDTLKDHKHLLPKYKNKFIILDKKNIIVFTATEIIFVSSYLQQ